MAVVARHQTIDSCRPDHGLSEGLLYGMSFDHFAQPEIHIQDGLPSSTFFEDVDGTTGVLVDGSVPHVHPNKKRRSSKSKVPAEIRRSASTPHMRSLGLSDGVPLSPTDKRRNKLGYHRTSVACGKADGSGLAVIGHPG